MVAMTLCEVCERETIEAPPGIHVSLTPLCARFLMCSDVKVRSDVNWCDINRSDGNTLIHNENMLNNVYNG